MRKRGEALALLALAAALTLPFLTKAFHVDDTYYLRISENVLANPLDPFAGTIDWWDRPLPIWELASNPPLLAYYLAPVAAWSGFGEPALHLAMLPFLWLLGLSVLVLARRFSGSPWLAVLFVTTSAGVMASVNVMRDVPVMALASAAVACVVVGTDRSDWRRVALGFGIAGLALLTRFNALLLLPLLVLYPLLKARLRLALWVILPLGLLGLWCVHNWFVYGEVQLIAQLQRGHNRPGRSWANNLCTLPVVVGSLLFLSPALVWRATASRDRVMLAGVAGAMVLAALGTWLFLGSAADAQFWLWSVLGSSLIGACLAVGLRGASPLLRDPRHHAAGDALFLLAWLGIQLVFAVWFVPFQAVRHLLPALPPLVLLALRGLGSRTGTSEGGMQGAQRGLLMTLVGLQAAVAFAVAVADSDYAESYRDFARHARARIASEAGDVWFLGEWGWLYYAEREGLHKLHTTGPYPAVGDILIIPANVAKGSVLKRLPRLAKRLHKVDEVHYAGRTPLRTMHRSGAGFYALYARLPRGGPASVPYRWLPGSAVETFEIHEMR